MAKLRRGTGYMPPHFLTSRFPRFGQWAADLARSGGLFTSDLETADGESGRALEFGTAGALFAEFLALTQIGVKDASSLKLCLAVIAAGLPCAVGALFANQARRDVKADVDVKPLQQACWIFDYSASLSVLISSVLFVFHFSHVAAILMIIFCFFAAFTALLGLLLTEAPFPSAPSPPRHQSPP